MHLTKQIAVMPDILKKQNSNFHYMRGGKKGLQYHLLIVRISSSKATVLKRMQHIPVFKKEIKQTNQKKEVNIGENAKFLKTDNNYIHAGNNCIAKLRVCMPLFPQAHLQKIKAKDGFA